MNKQLILGRVGQQPEIVDANTTICKFSVATSERWTKNGEKQERTDWHNVVAYGKTAETLHKYVNKGDQIYIEGKTRHRKYQDKNGIDRYAVDVEVTNFEFIGGGKTQSTTAAQQHSDALPF